MSNLYEAVLKRIADLRALPESDWWERYIAARRESVSRNERQQLIEMKRATSAFGFAGGLA